MSSDSPRPSDEQMPQRAGSALLRVDRIFKRFGGTQALNDVSMGVGRGEVVALLGENGAGKSTLIKIIAGVVQPDSGRMRLAGSDVGFTTPAAANAAGVVCIFQELSLMPDLSVADNISIASPPRRFGLIDAKSQRRRAEELLSEIGCEDVNDKLPRATTESGLLKHDNDWTLLRTVVERGASLGSGAFSARWVLLSSPSSPVSSSSRNSAMAATSSPRTIRTLSGASIPSRILPRSISTTVIQMFSLI